MKRCRLNCIASQHFYLPIIFRHKWIRQIWKFQCQDPQIGVVYGFLYGYDAKPQIFMPLLKNLDVHLTKLYLFW